MHARDTGVGVIDTGQLIAGHYRLEEHIGTGAMGIVWRAVDERLERAVAVKQIITQPGLSEAERVNVRHRAMREAKNAARFQHPNAIVVFDIAEHSGDPCLVMEYLPSKSLSAVLGERGTLPLGDVARIGEQVAAALVAAHRAGIVHRDIKPGNVLIDESGTVKITDFGISRAAGDMTLTQTGLIGGTPAYLAPELARGADPTPSSDVFALGATLYHAIEGQPPYGDSTNQLALLYSAASAKIIPPSQAGQATALLMSLLRAEPEQRPTMAEARERIAALAKGEQGHSGTLVSPPLSHGGRKPAAAAAPARPPWQRSEPSSNGHPPQTATASFNPLREEPSPPSPQAAPEAGTPARGSGRKRKQVLVGALAAVVLAIAATVTIVLTSSGGDDPNAAQPNPGPSASAPPPQNQAPPASSPGVPDSAQVTDVSAAGQLVVDFYDKAGEDRAWRMLLPPVQQAYGSPQKFAEYWGTIELNRWGPARKTGEHPDGSIDIRIDVDTERGPTQKVVRVAKVGGELRIASDPRLR